MRAYPAGIYSYWDGITTDTGDCDGCDVHLVMTLDESTSSLRWKGDCPVSVLPPAHLGFSWYDNYVDRQFDSGWAPQYYADPRDVYTYSYSYPGYHVTYQYMYYLGQLAPVTWYGNYEL
jgi:hypothetical protein